MKELQLKIIRNEFSDKTTIGLMHVDGSYLNYNLEDKDRGLKQSMTKEEIEKLKVYGHTCIPYTDVKPYDVVITYSNKFGIHYPLVLDTPGYLGIRVHCGTSDRDTLGCLLQGQKKIKDGLQQSALAFYALFEKLLVHKTNAATAANLINLHKTHRNLKIEIAAMIKAKKPKELIIEKEKLLAEKSAEFKKVYEENKNNNTISLTIEKATNVTIIA